MKNKRNIKNRQEKNRDSPKRGQNNLNSGQSCHVCTGHMQQQGQIKPIFCASHENVLGDKTEAPSHVRGESIALDLGFLTFMSVSLTRMRRHEVGGAVLGTFKSFQILYGLNKLNISVKQ